MRVLLESVQWAPRARAPQNSEHAVRVRFEVKHGDNLRVALP